MTTDLTLEKSVAVTEKVRFDIRGEFYNLLNHANFNVPGSTLGAADFGTVTSARAGRTIQLAGRLTSEQVISSQPSVISTAAPVRIVNAVPTERRS